MQLQIFKYSETDSNHFGDLATININGEIWFVASDVCSVLEIKNTSQAILTLDEDEKLPYVLDRAGQKRSVNIISESGLYALILRSRKPSAKRFRKWVTKEVIPSIRKTGVYGINRLETPNFIVRYNENWNKTDRGYFSVTSELFIRLYGRFEKAGYTIPNKALNGKEIRPDNSVGMLFSKHLETHHPEYTNLYKMYKHKFTNGLEFKVRQYENKVLPLFIDYIDDIWIPERAQGYFKERDPLALDYLPKLLKSG